jgi:hypothetical protein
MAPKSAFPQANALTTTSEKWVQVTWMPHTTLSQTSHVCLTIRSAHAVQDALLRSQQAEQEWKVRASVYGAAGLLLLPVSSHTSAAPVGARNDPRDAEEASNYSNTRPTVSKATHDCIWDTILQIPIRWRDLPRDAYLLLEVLGPADTVVSFWMHACMAGWVDAVYTRSLFYLTLFSMFLFSHSKIYRTPMPFFSRYGKLSTGLQRLELSQKPLPANLNHGLHPLRSSEEKRDDYCWAQQDDDDEDPVWKASCILYQLEQQQERYKTIPAAERNNSNQQFGQIPTVPWLDALQKQRARQILQEAALSSDATVRLVHRTYWVNKDCLFFVFSIHLVCFLLLFFDYSWLVNSILPCPRPL